MSMEVSETGHLPRAQCPTGNLRLPDGRLLLYQRAESQAWTDTVQPVHGGGPWSIWRTTDMHHLLVMAHMEPTKRHGLVLHVSLSYEKFYPSWEEIKQVKRLFFGPDRDVMQILARDAHWVNIQPNCFHLYECPEDWEML